MNAPPRVALALGSGGARGYAHIGVIDVLRERGYEIVNVAGSSMGALVGGLFAAGVLDEYAQWALGLSQLDVLRLLDPSLSAPGAIRAEKILTKVSELVDGARIEQLPVTYTAVATDLFARKAVWFQRGPLDVAIRASIALPSVITPVMLNGRLLADGGLMEPVPIAPVAAAQADLTIAVSLLGEGADTDALAPVRESSEARPMEEWRERIRRGASLLLDRDLVRAITQRFGSGAEVSDAGTGPVEPGGSAEPGSSAEPASPAGPGRAADLPGAGAGPAATFGDLPDGLGKLDVMNLSIGAMQNLVMRYRLAGDPPDVLVTVPRDACRSLDFHRAAEMIELGRTLATAALDRADGAGITGAAAPAGGPDGDGPVS